MIDTKAMRIDDDQQVWEMSKKNWRSKISHLISSVVRKEAQIEIKDNILIGKEIVSPESCVNAGEIILEIFKSKQDFVGQV